MKYCPENVEEYIKENHDEFYRDIGVENGLLHLSIGYGECDDEWITTDIEKVLSANISSVWVDPAELEKILARLEVMADAIRVALVKGGEKWSAEGCTIESLWTFN